MSNDVNAKMAHFIEVTSAALEEANQKVAAAETAKTAYANRVPEIVDSLIAMKYLQKESRAVAIQKLSDPAYALDQLAKLAAQSMQDPEVTNTGLGTAIEPTNAQPATTSKRASNKRWGDHGDAFVRSLGLDPAAIE